MMARVLGLALVALTFNGLTALAEESSAAASFAIRDARPRCQFQDVRINECSGLAQSRRDPNLLWTHNDSGDSARVFAVNLRGETVAVVHLGNATAHDWEDIEVADVGRGGAAIPYVYVGDIGDNASIRDNIQIYRFAEPALAHQNLLAKSGMDGPVDTEVRAQRLELSYPDGPHDAETLLVTPDGHIGILSKSLQGSNLYWTAVPFQDGATQTLEKIGALRFGGTGLATRLATGGDFSQNGRKLAVATYTHLYEWALPAPFDVRNLKIDNALKRVLPPMKQCEAVCYDATGGRLYLSGEQPLAPIYEVPSALAAEAPNGGPQVPSAVPPHGREG